MVGANGTSGAARRSHGRAREERSVMEKSLQDLAEQIDATVEGDAEVRVAGMATIETAGPNEVTFVANRRYLKHLGTTRAGAVILGPGVPCDRLPVLRCDDPYLGFAKALRLFHPWVHRATGKMRGVLAHDMRSRTEIRSSCDSSGMSWVFMQG